MLCGAEGMSDVVPQDAVLAMPMDVEDLARLGRRKEVCPYYAARDALQEADLVLLPYPALLLQASLASLESMRKKVGICMLDSITGNMMKSNGRFSGRVQHYVGLANDVGKWLRSVFMPMSSECCIGMVQEMRESLGMRLEGSVVIVDEAHNIVDAVNGVHSATMSGKQLATAHSALDNYYQRFRARLAPGA